MFQCLARARLRAAPSFPWGQGRGASHQLDGGTVTWSGTAEFLPRGMVSSPAPNSFCPARMGVAGLPLPVLQGSDEMLRGSRLHDGSSEVAKAPLCWRKVMLGKVKCSVTATSPGTLWGWSTPVPAESGLGHSSWQQSCLPELRVMDKALTPSPGRPRSRETLQTR